jgi:hypothetical protein
MTQIVNITQASKLVGLSTYTLRKGAREGRFPSLRAGGVERGKILFDTGCSADNSMVNKAFANSSLMLNIKSQLQEQADLIAEMQRMGVIPDVMATNLNSTLTSVYNAAYTL